MKRRSKDFLNMLLTIGGAAHIRPLTEAETPYWGTRRTVANMVWTARPLIELRFGER